MQGIQKLQGKEKETKIKVIDEERRNATNYKDKDKETFPHLLNRVLHHKVNHYLSESVTARKW